MSRQPWIHSAPLDGALVLAPAFLVSFAALAFPSFFAGRPVATGAWIALVLCVDVTHVYGSLYRTYFDTRYLRENSLFLAAVPVLCWVVGAMLYVAGLFWSALAYLAVFHFVRQQYGFLRIYARGEPRSRLDAALIYLATIYPLAWWHSHLPRGFHWFMEGDFFPGLPAWVVSALGCAYVAVAVAYFAKEARRPFNLPKQLLVLGTMLSWYVGIVAFNGDLTFTLTNVVAHGVPYFALVWAVGRQDAEREPRRFSTLGVSYARLYSVAFVPVFLGLLLLFAYLEEGLWDGFVWREHTRLFGWFQQLPPVTSPLVLAVLVPLLALPQSTHYVLDGFIWKVGRERRLFRG